MDTNERLEYTPLPTLAPAVRLARLALLALGPLLSLPVLLAALGEVRPSELVAMQVAVVLFWSPLPIAIPALLTQRARDQALGHLTGLAGSTLRAALLLPHLLVSKDSPVRAETAVSLVAWSVLCAQQGDVLWTLLERFAA